MKHVWDQECVPKSLVLCVFVMIYKNKGSRDDPGNYRAIGLLNHSYKILSVCILNRLIKETDWFLSEWQAGFRKDRGCRDNILLLRVIYDQYIKGNKKCVITFIDFAAAFDSVSHRYIDAALRDARASRKTRAMFRTIYEAAAGAARLRGTDGKFTLSKKFNIARGVIQGDIISPIFFIIALDQLVQNHDLGGKGVSAGHIKEIRVLGYADDASMCDEAVNGMTTRLTNFANAAQKEADMKVKLAKTFSQHVQPLQIIGKITDEEVEQRMRQYKHACEFVKAGCTQRFKTKTGMKIHSCNCNYNYGLTDEKWEVEKIIDVFGKSTRKLFMVKWKDKPGEDSWQKEHSLLQDGCYPSIKAFWNESGKNPASDYYPDPDGEPETRCWMCGWKSTAKNKKLGLTTHIRKKKHQWHKRRANLTERKDIKREKLEALQQTMPKVKWGNEEVNNSLQFLYLGSIFQTDGDIAPDVQDKCSRAKIRAGTLRHIWAAPLSLDLKLRLYISACCSILVYGSESWILNAKTCRTINGTNAFMLSHITGKTKREEATMDTTTFDIIAWIRARRLRWVGHIMRMDKNSNNEPRQIKETLKVIFENRQDGDILMDVHESTWSALQKAAADKDSWRARVRILKNKARATTKKKRTKTSSRHHTRNRASAIHFPHQAKEEKHKEDQEAEQ